MTTNVILGFPFGVLSILCHTYLFIFDSRQSFRYYNFSLLVWIVANFLWMTTEFVYTKPSSPIHFGPSVPIGGIPDSDYERITESKMFLFMIALLSQLYFYAGIYCNLIRMPEEEDEDQISKNEAASCCGGRRSYVKPVESDSIGDIVDGFSITGSSQSPINNGNNISLVFIENSYIVFWILKDMFWAFGTDDFSFIGTNEVICSESIAICFGAIAIAIYVFISYLYRRNSLVLMDCLSTILWIMANFVWMCGEFFLRYQNLRFDDGDEGNDSATRIAACVLFLGGILIQLFVVLELTRCYRNSLLVFRRCCNFSRGDHSSDDLSSSSSTSSSPGNKKDQKIIEMLRIQNPIKYKHVMVTFSPHHERKLDDDEEESTVLF